MIDMELNEEGTRVALLDSNRLVHVFSVPELEPIGEPIPTIPATRLAWCGEHVVVVAVGEGAGGLVRSLSPGEPRPIHPEFTHEAPLTALAGGPRGELCATGDASGQIHVWEVATGRMVTRFPLHTSRVRHLEWDPGEGLLRLLSMDEEGVLWVWPVYPGPGARARKGRELTDMERAREFEAF